MAQTGVKVTARRRRGQWSVTQPVIVEIDGATVGTAPWGRPAFFETQPGSHRLTVSYPYLWKERMDEASLDLHVEEGQTVEVEYRSSGLTMRRGTLAVT
jgi:hypothetical protein